MAVDKANAYLSETGITSAKPNIGVLLANIHAKTGRIRRKVICSLIGIPINLPICIDVLMMYLYSYYNYLC
ncbi:hypothetical protein MNV_160004 [Candidatus Methanoperedens nitroreducens]|uniref:Uncharacterized protein n=1 Tax=Candidatus Methanoperedens nitratireducens TaxID=1392998 RepID=A0A284VLE3_9EURY|nr:hypothetical protein MNV_160004 [Candidatus Methanoperedens nitroreducens]